MVKQLTWQGDVSARQLKSWLEVDLTAEQTLVDTVRDIIHDVRKRGDEAVIDYTNRFDGTDFTSGAALKVPQQAIDDAYEQLDASLRDALTLAAERIESYHKHQLPDDFYYTDEQAVGLGWKWTSVDAVGLYVPGGRAVYPSSVLMNAIPAKVAGVERIAMVVPMPGGEMNPLVLAAAKIAGVTEVYRVGGAQAVAALAYGTEYIAPVNTIVGPGNAYVAEAKRQVFGKVGIDMIAGPSEILVVADNQNDPRWIAVDLLSQAEHDPDARSVLVTDDKAFAQAVIEQVEAVLATLEREEIARASWENNGIVVTVPSLDSMVEVIDIVAAEHVELALEESVAKDVMQRMKHGSAIFVGRYTPEAIGDYVAGPSHVLPTGCSAAFSSGLSVLNFMKRSSIIACSAGSVGPIFEAGSAMAKSEGLGAHALSIDVRLNEKL